MKLELVSLTGVKYSDDAYEVVIPTADGEIAVYPNHMPLVSLAVPGMLSIRKNKGDSDNQVEQYATLGGVIEIDGTTVRILVDEVEHAEDIQEETARKAYEQAQKMKKEAKNSVELEKAQTMMDRQAIRLRVVELRRGHRRR